MVVRVDKPRRYDLVRAVDDFRARRGRDGWPDFGDEVAGDQEVGVAEGRDVVVGVVKEDRAVLEEDGLGVSWFGFLCLLRITMTP